MVTDKEIEGCFIPFKNYQPPTDETIGSRFADMGFKGSYVPSVVRAISNAFSHYYYGGTAYAGVNPDATSPQQVNFIEFVKILDYYAFTGITPLEKAANVIALFADKISNASNSTGGDGFVIPIFCSSKEDNCARVKAEMDVRTTVKDVKGQMLLAKLLDLNPTASPEMEVNNLSRSQVEMIEKLAILNSKGKIKARAELPKIEPQQMTEYGQATQLANLSAMAMPTYKYKLAVKDLVVNRRIQPNKQSLVMLIDVSGSMCSTRKQLWVQALLLNRLQAVVDNKAELVLVPFERKVYVDSIECFRTANDVYTSRGWKSKFYEFYDTPGGATFIDQVLTWVHQSIDKGMIGKVKLLGERPQVVIINDGEDNINPSYKTKYPTSAFILGTENRNLKHVVTSSGGIYERFL